MIAKGLSSVDKRPSIAIITTFESVWLSRPTLVSAGTVRGAAARLEPGRYAERAKKFEGWKEAERQYRRASHLDFQQREAMVNAMHREASAKREEEEEDAAVAAEAAEAAAAAAAAAAA